MKTNNKFFQEVIAEEDAIREECGLIKEKIKALENEITKLKKNDAFYYRQRKYCKFGDGYYCKFTGDCTHKEETEEGVSYQLFGLRCFAEEHARGEM